MGDKVIGGEEESRVKVAMWEERESRLMSLILRKEMTRGGLEMERRRVTLSERRKWSIIWSLSAVQLEGVKPEQQIKSRV